MPRTHVENIIPFNKVPSFALTIASPSTRLLVEKHCSGEEGRITVQLQPIPSQPNLLQRRICFNDPDKEPIRCLPPSVWWLQRGDNKEIPIALELPSQVSLYQEDSHIKVGNLKEWSPADTALMESYLQLGSLLSIQLGNAECTNMRWLRGCRSLEELEFAYSTSNITDFSAIASLSHLRVLRLEAACPSTLNWIRDCHNLTELSLQRVFTTTALFPLDRIRYPLDLSGIAQLRNLISLTIYDSYVSAVGWLADCTSLETLRLDCSDCPYPPIEKLVNLKCFELSWRNPYMNDRFQMVRGGPQRAIRFAQPSKLTEVILTRGSDDESIEWLTQCDVLENVSINSCIRINSFQPLGQLSWLKKLDLSESNVSDIEWIVGCTSLVELDVTSCAELNNFRPIGELTALKVLHISNDFAECNAAWLQGCTSLEHLDAGYCTHIDCASLSALRALRILSLTEYSAEGDSFNLEVLLPCTLLEELDLSGSKGVADLTPLSKLARLRSLNIQRTKATSIKCLAACPMLEELKLSAHWIKDIQCIGVLPFISSLEIEVNKKKLPDVQTILSELPYLRLRRYPENDGADEYTLYLNYDPKLRSDSTQKQQKRKNIQKVKKGAKRCRA